MKRLETRDPFRVGLVAVLVGSLVAGGVIVLSLMSFGTNSYTAVVSQTAGLRAGEDVAVHGVPAGKVKSIELDGNKVRVEFVLDGDVELGADTTAQVKVATLLGTHYLEVDPGQTGSLSNDTIPLSQTSVPFNLQDVLERGAAAVDDLDPDVIARALTETSKMFSATRDDIGPALTGVARLSEAVSRRNSQTTRLLRAASSVSQQLSDGSRDLIGLMRQASLVSAEVTRRREAIHVLLVETTALSRNLRAITNATSADLKPAFRQLNVVLRSLRAEDESLKRLARTAAPALRYVANATGSGPWAQLWTPTPGIPPNDLCQRLGNAGCP